MGEVWRATDTKLNREVAIKVLPAALANDPDYLARFTREAQVLAALNHPNIAAVYGVEDRAIVMELVEGRDLPTPVPVNDAIAIARQIAEALEAAHDRGIVHRDLKPANIKLTPEGVVKVLDFGLAKAPESAASTTNATLSPTLTIRATQVGVIMGTAAYMAPEQAAGKPVDRRADIWSFGVVLYEMLTGQQLFAAETIAHTLADVLRAEINLDKLPVETPAALRELLARCLDRDPRTRLRDIGEARVILSRPMIAPAPPVTTQSRWPWMVAATGLIASAAMGALLWRATRPVDRPLMRFHLDLGPDAVRGPHNTVAISPDGTRIVYPVRSGTMTLLATRLLDQPKATTLRDTESGIDPFFSPDGQWIGFFNNESLRKTPVQGGASVTLARGLSGPRGGAWGPNGEIIADLDNSRLERIPITGGNRQPLAALPPQFQERTWRWPQFLPGGDMFLFTGSLGVGYGNGYDDANIEVLSLKSGQRTVVANQVGYYGRYLPSGHLIYIHEGVLFAVPFNPATLKTRGTPLPVVDDVSASAGQGAGQFDFSQTGTLVYTSGKPNLGARMLSWMGPDGKTEPAFTASAAVLSPVLSPDGKLLAMGSGQIVVVDLQRRVETPLTSGSIRRIPAWAPDGKHLVYSHGERESAIWWIRADGSGGAQKLFESKDRVTADSISADGKYLAFSLQPAMGESHIWILPLDLRDSEHPVAGTPQRFVQEPDSQTFATFSPDGRWIAYQEVSSGTPNVFVRPFPANPTAGKWKISVNGGRHPVWSRTAKQLLYEGALRVQVVDYTIKGSVFEPGQTRRWSDGEITAMGTARNFDLSPDGKRIICAPVTADPSEGLHVTLLLNFFDELKRRLP